MTEVILSVFLGSTIVIFMVLIILIEKEIKAKKAIIKKVRSRKRTIKL